MTRVVFYRAVVKHHVYDTSAGEVPCVRLTNRRFQHVNDARKALGKDFIRLYEEDPLHLFENDEGDYT